MVNNSASLLCLITDNSCTKNEKSSFSKPKICSLYMRAVTDQELMSVFCGWLKFGSTSALNCSAGQNKGRYRKKELWLLLFSLFQILRKHTDPMCSTDGLTAPASSTQLGGLKNCPNWKPNRARQFARHNQAFFSLQLVTTQMTSSLSKNLFDMKQMLMKYKMFNRYLCSTSEVSSVCWHSHDTLSYHLVII